MTAVLTLVRLRWALTWATLKKSVWQTVGYVIALVIALGTIIGAAAAAWGVGLLPPFVQPKPDIAPFDILGPSGILNVAVVLVGTVLTLMVGLVQLMLLGEGSTMSPRKFALYGIPDRKLQFGLLISGLTGLPAITGLLSLMAWAFAYRTIGACAVVVALVAAPLAVITMMSLAKLLIALSTTLITSSRGKGVFYIVVIVLFIAACQVPNILINGSGASAFDPAAAVLSAKVAAWTPLGAAFQLPFDVAFGHVGLLLARIGVLVLTWVACFVGCTWCLRHERLTTGASRTVKTKGIGAFGWMPDSVSGAVSARLLTYLKRDPRQAMIFVMPVFFVIIFSLQSHGESMVIWQGLIWSGWMLAVAESNGLAYDGQGVTMQVIAGVRGWDDRKGRVRVYAAIAIIYLTVLAVGIAFATGDWTDSNRLLLGLMIWAIGLAEAFCGLGLSEITSCVFLYPVPAMDKPFSSPQGRAMAQGFFPFIYLLGSLLLLLPTGIVAALLALTGAITALYWVLIPVALANGVGMLVLGTWLGGKLLDARALSIVDTLDSFASLQH
ncbi:ABC transporter permease [Bifidobacterium olomucense]|uniref:ABC transporter permease n=1 Tax=Bifidobacterium olomucense TaxID=2675324 RepID=A0A7Y0HVJ6_9BIFI|nr:ABC transporter permease [Bifidobacterium sp. DSM 109959]NMM97291.1 ABC transporter permease [Bifidobacterium sp. DSM 109959]